jgi:putative membrane protein
MDQEENIQSQQKNVATVTNHLSNERTFLAWIRTSIGIMAFGFVVERFALFLRQLAYMLGGVIDSEQPLATHSILAPPISYTTFGIFLIALGALISLLAYIEFKRVAKRIETGNYQPSNLLNTLLMISVLLIGTFLAIYLNTSM